MQINYVGLAIAFVICYGYPSIIAAIIIHRMEK